MQSRHQGVVAIIADETLVTGFLLAGIGERAAGTQDERSVNFLVVPEEKEKDAEWYAKIKSHFLEFTKPQRQISVLIISQLLADQIRPEIAAFDGVSPCILEIGSKGRPYDLEKDLLVQRVRKIMGRD